MTTFLAGRAFALTVALAGCAKSVHVTLPADGALPALLWQAPGGPGTRDLFNGPWSPDHAPDPSARYRLIERKHTGVNPGMTVRDPGGREWSVKTAAPETSDMPEGPIEVVVSRVLSGLGYLQPPVYFLRTFQLETTWGVRAEAGGRFRLKDKSLKDRGTWPLGANPFVGTKPHSALLVIFMLLGSSDMKVSNNTLYEHRAATGNDVWYVVRDLGTALGSTARLSPRRGDVAALAANRFIVDVRNGFVVFDYHGWHQELVRGRITPEDVGWACELVAGLSAAEWQDAFRAGGYEPGLASRYIDIIQSRIALGRQVAATGHVPASVRR